MSSNINLKRNKSPTAEDIYRIFSVDEGLNELNGTPKRISSSVAADSDVKNFAGPARNLSDRDLNYILKNTEFTLPQTQSTIADRTKSGSQNLDGVNRDDGEIEEDFTLQDRQYAINTLHPFGIKIWKPALYKKDRSIDKSVLLDMYGGIASPSQVDLNAHTEGSNGTYDEVRLGVKLWNLVYAITFGFALWIFFVICGIIAMVANLGCGLKASGQQFAIFWQMACFLRYPFGKVLYLKEGLLSNVSDGVVVHDFQYQSNKNQKKQQNSNQPHSYGSMPVTAKYFLNDGLKDRMGSSFTKHIYWFLVNVVVSLFLHAIAAVMWISVVAIPMAHMLLVVLGVMRKFPLSFRVLNLKDIEVITKTGSSSSLAPCEQEKIKLDDILICTFKWCGLKYYKLTLDGTNVIVMNLMLVVLFTILDFYWFHTLSEQPLFILCLISTFPLSFYIGGAIASISLSTSMALGSVINALFSSIIEIFLYCVALNSNKGLLVEGGIIGSLLAGTLCLPGVSMLGGSLFKKTQYYNPKSAGVSSAMLIFAILTMLIPSWVYIIYGGLEMVCEEENSDCYLQNKPLALNSFYTSKIEPLSFIIAVCLFLVYMMGLWFTLKTHASMIWSLPISNKEESNFNAMRSNDTATAASVLESSQNSVIHEATEAKHDAPNWSKTKAFSILLTATVLYSIIAEILIHCLDFIIQSFPILKPKFLGVTVFALVPNLTEFLNAYSFARNGNVSLSMEIGSAYVLQVVLLQIPALVIYSVAKLNIFTHGLPNQDEIKTFLFTLVFPNFDLMATMSSVFLFTYLYGEGKSNYLKGTLLLMFYAILILGLFLQSSMDTD
ncbi:hypothetical protein QEN19_004002 [Hanseniaspora menglaensis]